MAYSGKIPNTELLFAHFRACTDTPPSSCLPPSAAAPMVGTLALFPYQMIFSIFWIPGFAIRP